MRRVAAVGAAILALAGIAQAQSVQELEARRREVSQRAQQLTDRGEHIQATLLVGEAYAIQSEIDWLEGREPAAEDDWREALRRGWLGRPPWQTHPRGKAQDEGQEEPPPIEGPPTPTPEPPKWPKPEEKVDCWPYFAASPYHHSRNGVWHSLLGTPPFEAAAMPPARHWQVRTWMELASADFSDTAGGGRSIWNVQLHNENIEANYSISNVFQVGARLSSGELYERDDELIRVFQDNTQIVPTAERGFGADSFTARAKYAGDVRFGDAGVLLEVKVPLSDEGDLLSAQTVDVAVVGLFTKKFGRLLLHLNAGMVLPLGDPKIFVDEFDDVNDYIVGGIGVVYVLNEWLTLGLQVEGNTTAFEDIGVLDQRVVTVTGRAHVRLAEETFLGVGVGRGLDELSGDFMGSVGLEFGF